MRGQRLLIVTLGVAILINLCSSIHTNSSETGRNGSKRGSNAQLESRLSEMAKEFGATSFEETSEESTSSNEDSHAPKQHVKRLISSENHQQEFEVYQGVMGRPGIDFPVLPSIPKTTFSCRNVKSSGYYADLDTDCQVFHICADGRKISFLCPNGTIFRQSHLICDWWWTVDCASSREQYDESAELLAHDRKVYHQDRSEALSKARAAQRGGGGKQSLISYEKEYEVGASATVTSVSTEPNARVVGRTRAPKKGKYFLTSPKPSLIKDISYDAPFSSDDFQGGSSMELAEQRGFHSYHTPPDFTYRQENRQQISANQNVFSESIPTQLPSQGTRAYEASSFSQGFPSSTENVYQFKDVSTPAILDQTTNPVPTTHRPPFFYSKQQSARPTPNSRRKYKGRTLENQQFSQIQPEQLKQRDTLNTYKEQPRKRFPQPQTTATSQTNRPKYLRSKPTQQTNVNFEKEAQNNDNDDKPFSSTESEGQQLAETGSFFGNRANQLDNVHHKIQAITSRPSRERTTSTPPVTSTELPNDPYVDISKIKPQAPIVDEPQSGRPIVIPETGFGPSGPFSSSWEQGNSASYYDDVVNAPEVEDEEPFDDDVHPPSAEQFKDEDIFYLRISTSEKSISTTTTSKPGVTQAVANEEIDGPIDLIGDFRLPESNSEIIFEDYPIAVHSTSDSPHNSHSSITRKSSSATYVSSTTPVTTTEVQSKIGQLVVASVENKTVFSTEDQHGRIPAFSDEIPEYTRSNETASVAKIQIHDETKDKSESLSTVIPRYEAEKLKPLLDTENVEAITSEEFESIKTKLQSTTALPENYSDSVENLSQVVLQDVPVKEEITDNRDLKNNTNEEINSHSTDTLQISVTSEVPVTVDTITELITRSKPRNLRKRLRSRTTTTPSTKEPNVQYTTEASIESSASSPKGVQFPKREKGKVLSPFLRTTTFSPPTTVYVTLSRRVKPPVLILSSTDPRETASSKIRESIRNRNKAGKSKTELDKSITLPIDAESTTPIAALNVSRRVKPPRFNSSGLLSKRNKNQNARLQKFSTTPLPEPSTEFTVLPTLLVSTTKSPIELLSTSSSKHGRIYPSSTLVPSSKLRSTTEAATTDSPTIKEDLGLRNLIRETEKIPQLKQELTSTPQYGNRFGLNIPPSSAPSTLHSLAAYFADKENSNGSETVSSTTVSTVNSEKANPVVNSISSTSAPTPTTEAYITSTNVDESETPPEFLTQAIKDSYSALFPKRTRTTTTQAPTTSTRLINKERETSGSEQNELRNQLLDKLVEMSHMDILPEAERNRTIELMRNMPHSDTEDLLQGTDSHDLRELAQIFSRALSAYLENPEEFKRVLNGIRPTEPPVISGKGLEDYNPNSVSSTSTTESTSHEDDEVLHFSDVPNVPQRKRISTTAVPIYRSSSPLPPTFVDVNFLSESSTVLSKISTTSTDLGDVDTSPPSERLEKSESSYYSSKEGTTAVPAEETSYISSTFKPNDTELSDHNLSVDATKNKEPTNGLQSESLNFAPTAGGVSDPTRPRYGGFQNNSQELKGNNGRENKTASGNFSDINETVPATTFTPSVRYGAKEKETIETTTEAKYTALPKTIGNILATFAPEDLNNLAIADDDVEESSTESSTVTSETSTISDILEESLLGANTASFGSSKQYHSNYIKSNKKLSEPVNAVDAIAINRELSESNINVESIALNDTSTAAESTGKLPQKENSNVNTNTEIKNAEFITSTLQYVTETTTYTETTELPRTTESQKSSESILYLTDNMNRTLQSLKSESESPSAVPLIQTTDTTSEYLSNKLQKEYSERYLSASTSSSVITDSPQAASYIPHHSIFSSINCSSFTKKIPDETTHLPDSTTSADAEKDTTEIVISSQSRYSFTTTVMSTEVKEDNLEKDSSNEEPIAVQVTTTESPYEQHSVTSNTLLPEAFAVRTHSPITATDLPSTFATEKTNERVLEGSSPKESVINSLYSVGNQARQEKQTEISIPSKSTSKASISSTGIPTSFGESTQQKIDEIESIFATTSKPDTEESDEPMTVDQIEALEHLQTMLFPTDSPIIEDGKMFGNLNESSTLLLINTMKQAVTNSTVRRLVLLLVNSLKDGTPEETRDILIEALLRIPCERREEAAASQYESFTVSKIEEKTTDTYSTTQLPITTTRFSSRKVSTTQPSLDKEETKTVSPVSAETINEENTSNNSSTVRESKNLSDSESPNTEEDTLPESDTRAVELLRSLYSLASRWG